MPTSVETTTVLSEALRAMYANMHQWLEGTFGNVSTEQAHWQPSGRVVPAVANYAHHILAEDLMINMMARGATPLMMGEWQGRTGFSDAYPMEEPWDKWARGLKVDLDAHHRYAEAVYASTDAYLTTVTPEEWERPLDLTPVGMGHQTVGYLLTMVLLDGGAHCGEISAIKGLQGLQGYPF